jgi:transcriptional regulator with PAS, ATPase and Fis domain
LFGCEGGASSVVVGDGARTDPGLVERVAAANVPIAPHRCDDRIEAGAPVRYGGMTIGVLTARWPLGTPYDLSRASTMLTAAAVATAPVVSAVISRRRRAAEPAIGTLLGVSPVMSELRRLVERAAAAPFAVLIEGESGSGKELVARAVHRLSARRDRPFTTLNCAALPDELLEAELFGHARGAFTGAVGDRIGVFEEAHGGTLFLDEVGELSPRAQAKLLRAIQDVAVERVGGHGTRRVNTRIVAATNRSLSEMVTRGLFRSDLYYRLGGVEIHVPPLRERREDICELATYFLSRHNRARELSISDPAADALRMYTWPGNVRELERFIERAVALVDSNYIELDDLPPQFRGDYVEVLGPSMAAGESMRAWGSRYARLVYERCGRNKRRACRQLDISYHTLEAYLSCSGRRRQTESNRQLPAWVESASLPAEALRAKAGAPNALPSANMVHERRQES